MSVFNGLEPILVWKYFNEILSIPRPSKREEKITKYLKEFAEKHKLEFEKDNCGNVVIKKQGVGNNNRKNAIVLQSHMDMVCEKNSDSVHDFYNDSILPIVKDGWVMAQGTTLGADDGIGMAMQLAILASDNIEHPPLECLFTVDEETGLTGAFGLSTKLLSGRKLINLDSEDEGEVYIGCAGGKDTVITMFYDKEVCDKNSISFNVNVRGLKGGHSGDDINKGRGNSIKILNSFLLDVLRKISLQISVFNGGNLRNAIPREANAIVTIQECDKEQFYKIVSEYQKTIRDKLGNREPNVSISITETKLPEFRMEKNSQQKLLNSINSCPNGVIKMSEEIPELVETSTNLASIKFNADNIIEIVTSQRSSVESEKEGICNVVFNVFSQNGANVNHTDGYPGWKPNTDSELLKLGERCYENLYGVKPKVKAIHAGLECGLFLEKYPDMDMISIGPTIKGVHSPDERLNIESVLKCWEFLLEILKRV